jgi:hypothetical protein
MTNKNGKWKGFVNVWVILQPMYQQGQLKVQLIPSLFSSRWLTITGLFLSSLSLLLRREDYVPVLLVNCTVSRSLLQGHGYRNTGRTGKLEGADELAYGIYLAQLKMLLL